MTKSLVEDERSQLEDERSQLEDDRLRCLPGERRRMVPRLRPTLGRPIQSGDNLSSISVHKLGLGNGVVHNRVATPYERFGKRSFDLILGSVLLVTLSPLIAVVAALVRLSLGRKVVFRQPRIGRNGEAFTMFKFRTMRDTRRVCQGPYAGVERRVTHKSDADPRHTSVGRFLRRTSLDELPQLVHVVSGRMSLVGPRPELATIVERHGLVGHPRHQVRPGITGPWQVGARNSGRLLHECFDDDLSYLAAMSLRVDLGILRRTVRVLLLGAGR